LKEKTAFAENVALFEIPKVKNLVRDKDSHRALDIQCDSIPLIREEL
jgi:hypothetical protein|tara:strand:- start:642 stop:782 length:141 start_codon:yes stop_codon:yes gene_type:complete